jgi:hypothetical protein
MYGDVIDRCHEKPFSIPEIMGLLEAVKLCILIGPEASFRTYACRALHVIELALPASLLFA